MVTTQYRSPRPSSRHNTPQRALHSISRGHKAEAPQMAPETSKSHKERLTKEITENMAAVLKSNADITPGEAVRIITLDMLANNPWVPPAGCPVNDLPNELLGYIFLLGTKMEAEEDYMEDEDEDEDAYDDELNLMDGSDDSDEEDDPRRGAVKMVFADKVAKGGREQPEENDSDDSESDSEYMLPFQVLVSHVCRHWREVSLGSPTLWSTLTFSEGAPFERSRTWLERSKGSPLDLYINCTIPDEYNYQHAEAGSESDEDSPVEGHTVSSHGQQYDEEHKYCDHLPPPLSIADLGVILDMTIPHVAHWRLLEVTVSIYEHMYTLLARLAQCPPAPLLETLELYHYDDCEDYDTFEPQKLNKAFLIFSGSAPRLSEVALWGVHLDWDPSLSFLNNLHDLELAYHPKDVRPSFATFAKLIAASPNLHSLTLSLSGPTEHDEVNNNWGTEPLEIPSLKDLVLRYHDVKYATALLNILSTPNVHSLALDYDESDYTEFAQRLTKPIRGKSKSLLAGLEHLKISGLPCNDRTVDMMFEQLVDLKSLDLNCSGMEEIFFDRLMKPPTTSMFGSGQAKVYCPHLHSITTTGIEGSKMKQFVEARKGAGVPLKYVFMSENDDIDKREEIWLREHLEGFELIEPSDSEEDIDIDDDDMDID